MLMAVQSLQGLAAQALPRTADDLGRALASESATEVAAAAAAARTTTHKQLVSRLQKTLRAWSTDRGPDSNRVRLHLLDALIAQRARLPAAELLPLLEDPLTNMPAFILLCLEPQQNQAELLGMFRELKPGTCGWQEPSEIQRLALGNLLCRQKAPGFAALLWQQARFDLQVTVRGPGLSSDFLSFELYASKVEEVAAGFPPEPVYWLQRCVTTDIGPKPEGAIDLLAPGTQAVEFLRAEKEQGAVGTGAGLALFVANGDESIAWLETMAGCRLGSGEDPRRVVLDFTMPAAFVSDVVAARQRLTRARRDLRVALLAAGALTTEEASVADPVVEVIVADNRSDMKTPLPAIPEAK
jgi:hypothetical protein